MTSKTPPTMNPWELQALSYEFPNENTVNPDGTALSTWRQVQDPVIYPGLYAPSGFDIMDILFRVVSRPNPRVVLGAVDCSVSLILCDLCQPDIPIVYATDAFTELTGYSASEAIGKNCRFLQAPPGKDRRSCAKSADKSAIRRMRHAVEGYSEIQLEVTNYKKDGKRFTNILTIIPVPDCAGYRYAVGFQSEK